MTPNKSEKQITLYGQLLINFANARNTDEAYKELIKGIQRAFNFSKNFVKQSEKALPSLIEYKSKFSKQEKIFIKLIFIERNLKYYLNNQFGLLNNTLIDYDSESNTLTFKDIIYHGTIQDGDVDVDFELSKPYTMHVEEIDPDDYEMMKPDVFDKIKQLMKVGNAKKRFRQNISEERYLELKSLIKMRKFLLSEYEYIEYLHENISLHQNCLKTTLNDIVEGRNLYNIKTFKEYLEKYRSDCKLELTLQRDGSFSYDSDFLKEKYYLKHKDFIFEAGGALDLPIAYSLIEFLLNYDRKKLKYCPYCDKFFIAKSTNRKTRCYESDCEKAYQRDKKRKQREKEPDIYY